MVSRLRLPTWLPGPRSSWIVTGRSPRKWGTSTIPADFGCARGRGTRGPRAHGLRSRRMGVPARRAARATRPRGRRPPRRGRLGDQGARAVNGTWKALRRTIDAFAGRSVVVIGDLILDEYLFGKPARISREAPVLILRFAERQVFLGGAANAPPNVPRPGARGAPTR